MRSSGSTASQNIGQPRFLGGRELRLLCGGTASDRERYRRAISEQRQCADHEETAGISHSSAVCDVKRGLSSTNSP